MELLSESIGILLERGLPSRAASPRACEPQFFLPSFAQPNYWEHVQELAARVGVAPSPCFSVLGAPSPQGYFCTPPIIPVGAQRGPVEAPAAPSAV